MKHELCGCCNGLEKLSLLPVANRPGLKALSYRVGTHATFLEAMQARLAELSFEIADAQGSDNKKKLFPLKGLRIREADDPAIALLDAWAIVADVLSFYQERIANEGFLRTATERLSILELARLVGYKLRPGVAASVYLAFTLENGYEVEIPAGTRAQSLPAAGELPQPFETSEPLAARADWNNLSVRRGKPQFITSTSHTIYLKGVNTNLKSNDPLLIIDSLGNRHFRRVLRTNIDALADRTEVILTTKGEIGPNLSELERLIQSERIPEEEGPYSVAIGDHVANEIRDAMKSLVALFKDRSQPITVLKHAIRLEIPRLEQTIRVMKALNFEILEKWFQSLWQQLVATLQQLELRIDEPGEPVTLPIDLNIGELDGILSENPKSSGRFANEIGAAELDKAKESSNKLVGFLDNSGIRDEDKVIAIQAEILRLDQLQSIFDELKFTALSNWVTELRGLFVAAITNCQLPDITGPRSSFSLAVSLNAIVNSMLKYVNPPPANALRLNRTVSRIYSSNSDMGPRLLTAMQPSLKSTLPQARRNLTTSPGLAQIYALRTTASLFGYNQPKQIKYKDNGTPDIPENWPERKPEKDEAKNVVFLDSDYDEIIPGSYIAIQRPDDSDDTVKLYGNVAVRIRPRFAYGLSSKTTEIKLPVKANEDGWWDPATDDFGPIRGTTVYAQNELLELADEPIKAGVEGTEIELGSLYDGLDSGRWLIVSGERSDIPGTGGVKFSELVMLAGVSEEMRRIEYEDGGDKVEIGLPGDKPHTILHLANRLAYSYERNSVTIYGNVVKASHGETREEVLGSGNSSKALQEFALKQSPLTYLATSESEGTGSTLEVRIDNIRWHEAASLAAMGSTDRGYLTRTDDEDKTIIGFGNGQFGARLPTGIENVTAVYRNGIGKSGNVAAKQISLLATRPLGVKGVINPLRASGGADRDSRDQARRNVPLPLMALDRLVSVQDYADFARGFAGIGKASATKLSDGRRELVHVTITGINDIPIDETSDLYHNLRHALHQFGDPFQPLQVAVRELGLLVIAAKVRLLPDYQWESVAPKIRAAMLETFSFDRRELGQNVLLSEVIATMQAVAGVAYVDVDILDKVDGNLLPDDLSLLGENLKLKQRIVAETARIQTVHNVERTGESFASIAGRYGTTEEEMRNLNSNIEENPDTHQFDLSAQLRIPRMIRPAQLAYLTREPADTLILTELTS